MPASKSRIETKIDRLRQLEILLLSRSGGMTQSDAARALGVDRATIHRYTLADPHILVDDAGRITIERSSYMVNVRFSLHEALALHLAAHLLAGRMDRHHPNAASAVRKLGHAIQHLAPTICAALLRSAGLLDSQDQWYDPTYIRCLEALTEAWASARKVHLAHRSPQSGEIHTHVFCPYAIQPGGIGQAIYAIGWSDTRAGLRTFKIERLESVEILRETYTVQPDFNPDEYLSDAWGVWIGEGEPVEVILRFSSRVAARVKETRWHRSQHIEEQPDGSLVWTAWVAEPQEMLYWIRGWGPEVEVCAPAHIRAILAAESAALTKLYNG